MPTTTACFFVALALPEIVAGWQTHHSLKGHFLVFLALEGDVRRMGGLRYFFLDHVRSSVFHLLSLFRRV